MLIREMDMKEIYLMMTYVIIVDAYNPTLSYPNDSIAREAIKHQINVTYYDKDDVYLQKIRSIEETVRKYCISKFFIQSVEFLIYNAGSDILQDDPLGALDITPNCMIERDRIIFDMCKKYNIPILMLLSGGYQKSNAKYITRSIQEIIESR
ncbi:Histone deacetylase 11 [Paramecium bursaria]